MRRPLLFPLCALALIAAAVPARAETDPTPSASASPSVSQSPTESASPSPSPSVSASPSVVPSPSPATKKESPLDQARTQIEKVGDTAPGGAAFTGDAANKRRIQDLVAELDSQITVLAAEVSQLFAQTGNVQKQLTQAEQRTNTARTAANQWRDEFRREVGRFYMTGAWENTLPVMNSRDMDDVATVRVYMHSVLDTASGLVDRYRSENHRFRVEQDQSTTIRQSLRSQIARQQAEMQRLSLLRSQKQEMLGEVLRSFGTGSSAISSLIHASQESQVAPSTAKRFVMAPLSGSVSSPFGWRIHPLYGYRSFHTGIDLSAPHGRPIHAARDGVVLESALVGPFGLATVIDNGERIATVYAHQSYSMVRPGQRVKAGQIIGLVGCSGWCTGPHLHFEVWFDGHPVDPLPWLAHSALAPSVRLA